MLGSRPIVPWDNSKGLYFAVDGLLVEENYNKFKLTLVIRKFKSNYLLNPTKSLDAVTC